MTKLNSAKKLIEDAAARWLSSKSRRAKLESLDDGEYELRYQVPLSSADADLDGEAPSGARGMFPLKLALDAVLRYTGQDQGVNLDELLREGEALSGLGPDGWIHDCLVTIAGRQPSVTAFRRELLTIESVCEAILDNALPLLSIDPRGDGEHSRFVIARGFRVQDGRVTDLLLIDPVMGEVRTESVDRFGEYFKDRAIFLRASTDLTSWAEINLDAIRHNVSELKRVVGDGVRILAVVKADAYGHGLTEVSRVLAESQAISGLGVATLDEAREVRSAVGPGLPILLLYHVAPAELSEIPRFDISLSVYREEVVQMLDAEARAAGVIAKVHLVVDTGMGWYGLDPDDTLRFAKRVSTYENVEIEGLYTHFSQADDSDPAKCFTKAQVARFSAVVDELRSADINPTWVHAANSAALLSVPESRFDMVRPGIALYGVYPKGVDKNLIDLAPALSYKTRVLQVRHVDPDTPIGYGGTWSPDRASKIAVLPVGYSDGLSRMFSNKSEVIIRQRRAKIVGNVCMNITMVDVTHIEDVQPGDPVTLIGAQNGTVVGVDELAEGAHTISYEVLTSIGNHVPRIHLQRRQEVSEPGSGERVG